MKYLIWVLLGTGMVAGYSHPASDHNDTVAPSSSLDSFQKRLAGTWVSSCQVSDDGNGYNVVKLFYGARGMAFGEQRRFSDSRCQTEDQKPVRFFCRYTLGNISDGDDKVKEVKYTMTGKDPVRLLAGFGEDGMLILTDLIDVNEAAGTIMDPDCVENSICLHRSNNSVGPSGSTRENQLQ